MKKGFTLIELLAVIVILAIIALITIPIIADSISESRKSGALRSAELYTIAVDQELAKRSLDGDFSLEDGWYDVNGEGNIELLAETLIISAKNKPTGGSVYIENLAVKNVSDLELNSIKVSSNGDKFFVSNSSKIYKPGEVVYFDVQKGTSCTEDDYKASSGDYYYTYMYMDEDIVDWEYETVADYGNSVSEYIGNEENRGCLKFYVVSDSGDGRVTLILDHNIEENVDFDVSSDAALEDLHDLTEDWKGTLTPTNYTYHRDENACYKGGQESECEEQDYTIDYTGYRARLITAEEVAGIVKKSNLIKTDVMGDGIDLFSEGVSTSENTNKYGWLYDRLVSRKDIDPVPNKAIFSYEEAMLYESDYGYYTATLSNVEDGVRYLSVQVGALQSGAGSLGIRPVIEVSKDNL